MSLIRSGVDDGSLRVEGLLRKSIKVVEDTNRRWTDPGDSAWMYNERASLSILAGAVWRSKGIAFEEYSVEKYRVGKARRSGRLVHGRADLYFELDSRHYLIEEKQAFCPAGRNANSARNVEDLLRTAVSDASRNVPGDGWHRLGAVFAVPKIPISQFESQDELLSAWLDQLRSSSAPSIAWCFPKGAQKKTWGRHHYPGVVLILRE